MIKERLFGNLDFYKIENDPDFKEDSVREVIILPILKELGYQQKNITRSKKLIHPFLKIGTNKIAIKQYPDYLLKVENNFAWVLDAKSPSEGTREYENVEQVFSYAAHREINTVYFALCNGKEFTLYRTMSANEPVLSFSISEIDYYWNKLKYFLSQDSFQAGKNFTYESINATAKPLSFDYKNRPLLEEIVVKKQQAKRHFGVHGYFTKQTWNVVAEYIKNYSKPGDLVLDPFGGSGITAVEALMNDRKAINIDLNPMAVFMVKGLLAPINITEFIDSFQRIKKEYGADMPVTKDQIKVALKKYPYPKGLSLPKGSDVNTIEELFTQKQLAQLAFLKYLIKKEQNENIQKSLLLAFSSTITKTNRTYHNSEQRNENAGDSAAFRYYRYRIAISEVDLDVWNSFETKFKKILNAKQEISPKINDKTIENVQIIRGTATNLKWIPQESVDYIYTDPPYGKKIPYLDLSVMWNGWLDLVVTKADYEQEAIEGGEQDKTKENYNALIAESIKEMYRVLKFDRWLSFVFAHKDPEFWHLIMDTAEGCGFEYIGAVPQKNGQSSFKKRQNPFTVLSGQLIINFQKVRNPRAVMKANLGMGITEIVTQTIEGIIAKSNGATLEQINDELIIKGLELGFLDLLKKQYSDLTPLLLNDFDFNDQTQKFTIREAGKFKTHLDVRLRIRYYLYSYLSRNEREGRVRTFDEIILYIIPLLKNGTTPEEQTILKVLEDIGEHLGNDQWKLKSGGQQRLFI